MKTIVAMLLVSGLLLVPTAAGAHDVEPAATCDLNEVVEILIGLAGEPEFGPPDMPTMEGECDLGSIVEILAGLAGVPVASAAVAVVVVPQFTG